MTGNQLIAAYTEIVQNDLFPVLGINASGVDPTYALYYVNLGAERAMRLIGRHTSNTFSFTSGTYTYNFQTATATRFYMIDRIKVNNAEVDKVAYDDDTNEGWYVSGESVTFNTNYSTGATVKMYGAYLGASIVASDSAITDLPSSLMLAIAQFAVLEACGTHDVQADQQVKLSRMQDLAETACMRVRNTDALNAWPDRLSNGRN